MSDPGKAVFLSYASQDAEAAKKICDALRAAGVEVWFDAEGGLEHGDEWDAKIRRQIKECVLFLPIISANTQAREEGYFRIEWELAAQRALGIASGVAFILPIVIDDTREPDALVPDRFRSVQWTRLRGGELTPEVKARFLKLWSHRAGVVKHQAGAREQKSEVRSQGIPAVALSKPGWKVYAGLAAAIFALVAVTGWWMLRHPGPADVAPAAAKAPAPAASAPRISGARQLVAKAWELMNKADLGRADLELADGYCRQATELDTHDADAWAAWSQADSWTIYHNYDRSQSRREGARTKAERSMQLAPGSYEARLARACQLVRGSGSDTVSVYAAEVERQLRTLLQENPDEPRALLALGILLRNIGKAAEFRETLGRLTKNPAFAVLAWNELAWAEYLNGNPVAAGLAIERSIAQQPYWGNLLLKELLAQRWLGDLDEAKAAVDRMPVASLQDDSGVSIVLELSYWRREPQAMLSVLASVPRDWMQSNAFTGPTAYWAALAHRMAGHQAAAQLQWRTALAVVERRLAQQPDSALLINWKGRLLAVSGDRVAAGPLLRLAREMSAGGSDSSDEAADQLALGNLDSAIDQLERSLTAGGLSVTAAAYRLDPDLDPVRSLPRFQALLARMETDPRFSPNAKPPVVRDWPKDPELKKAFDIVIGLDATVESCRLAEDMVNGVLKQRPTDPDATVVYAMLNNYFLNRGYDSSEERFVLARRFAERALQLAPEEPEALAAMGQFLTFRGADFARAEELVRRAMTLAPQEPRFGRILSYNVLRVTNLPKALEQAKANVARFPGDPLMHYDLALICRGTGELELMEQALDRAIALAPLGSAMIWKGWLAAWMHGDLPGFKSWLDRITGNFRSNERAVYMRYLYASLSGDAAYGLDAVRSYTGTWMSDFYYIGPRSLLLADLLALQGKAELAREEYGRALAEIDRVAQRSPEDTSWERARFWALRGAGRTDEARVAAKRMVERLGRPYRPVIMFWWHDPISAQLLAGDRADALVLIGEAARTPVIRSQIRLALKIDRRMAPFRDDPEIQALLAEPEVKK